MVLGSIALRNRHERTIALQLTYLVVIDQLIKCSQGEAVSDLGGRLAPFQLVFHLAHLPEVIVSAFEG